MDSEIEMISIADMHKRRIQPILNRILKKQKILLSSEINDSIVQHILDGLSSTTIMDESDQKLLFQILQIMETQPVNRLLNDVTSHSHFKRINYDLRHKEIIRHFLPGFFGLFFPDLAPKLKFESAHFLDKELIALFGDLTQDEQLKIADTLILIEMILDKDTQNLEQEKHTKINRNDTKKAEEKENHQWIMIHWEVQGYRQLNFNERMFHIFCGIYYQYRKRILPIAMFIDPHKWRKPLRDTFSMNIMNYPVVQSFTYQQIKLKNYTADEFEKKDPENPLTYAYLPLTDYPKADRPLIKAKSISGMFRTVENEKQKAILYSLIDASLQLTKDEHRMYTRLIEKNSILKEAKMFETVEEYILEKGREEGLEEGLEKGREEGLEEGLEKGRNEIISNIVNSGLLTLDQVVEATGVEHELVQKIMNSLHNIKK